MKKYNIKKDFNLGWFLGSFEKSLVPNCPFEVAIKYYKKGDYDAKHYHKISTEYTVIVKGLVMMNGEIYRTGDLIVIEPNEATDFKVLSTEAITCVVKNPGALNDKYNVK